MLGITNASNSRVSSFRLIRNGRNFQELGSLNPGTGIEYHIPWTAISAAIVSEHFQIKGTAPDPNPDNNVGIAITEVRVPAPPGVRQVPINGWHLIASADGIRLYVALASQLGRPKGVAEIDPSQGTIVRILSGDVDPSRLAITADGRSLYAQVGFQTLVRWNLASGLIDLRMSFPETIHDFLCLDDPSQGLVVATTGKVRVYDGAKPRPLEFVGEPYQASLTRVGSRLWLYSELIQELKVSPAGIEPTGPSVRVWQQRMDYGGVPGDGRRLYFRNEAFDLSTGLTTPFSAGSAMITEPSKGILCLLHNGTVVRYSMDTLKPLGSFTFDPTLEYGSAADLVRWGAHGVAMRRETSILITEYPVLPLPGQTDLGVSVILDPDWQADKQFEHLIRVTNDSDTAATGARLQIRLGGEFSGADLTLQGSPSYRAGGVHLVNLPELAPKSSFTVSLRGVVPAGGYNLFASVIGATLDPNPDNKQTDLWKTVPPLETDLAIEGLALPTTANPGDIVSSRVVVRNLGTSRTTAAKVHVTTGGLRLISAAPFNPSVDCCSGYFVEIGNLLPGESREMELQFQTQSPGLMVVNLEVTSANIELRPTDNFHQQLVRVLGPSGAFGLKSFSASQANIHWSENRQQLVASAPYPFPAIDLLDPDEFQLRQRLKLPGGAHRIALTEDGTYAWARLVDGQGLVRINLNTGEIDRNYSLQAAAQFSCDLAVLPGDSDSVVVAEPIENTSTVEVRGFRNGRKLPQAIALADWNGGEISLAVTDDRIFISTGTHFRELRWMPDGLEERRNWDSLVARGSISYARGHLVFNSGTLFNLSTGTREQVLESATSAVADTRSGQIYYCLGTTLEALSGATLKLNWALDLPEINPPIETITPLGGHGFLLRGADFHQLPFIPADPIQANLGIQTDGPGPVLSTNVLIPILIQVTNHSIWNAGPLTVELELSPGLEFVDDELPSGTKGGSIQLKDGVLQQTRTVNVRALTQGSHLVQAKVSGQIPDPDASNNRSEVHLQVLPPPTFLVEDLAIQEGSASEVHTVRALLSHAVPWEVVVDYTVVSDPPRPWNWNLNSDKGVFRFPPGARTTEAAILRGDSIPELDKTFQIQFSSSSARLSRPDSRVTLLNDDFPQLNTRRTPVTEGNAPITFQILVELSTPCPFPVQASYRWVGNTAQAGTDFLESEGRILFLPGQTTLSIPLTILGDRIVEGTEQLHAEFFNLIHGVTVPNPEPIFVVNDDLPGPILKVRGIAQDRVSIEFISRLGLEYRVFSTRDLNGQTWEEEPNSFQIGTGLLMRYDFEVQEGSTYFQVMME